MDILEASINRGHGIWINIPIVIAFDDYHEIKNFEDRLNDLRVECSSLSNSRRIKSQEIGFDGQYIGIFYFNKKDPEYKRLLKEHQIIED